jgi:hypothetical protein
MSDFNDEPVEFLPCYPTDFYFSESERQHVDTGDLWDQMDALAVWPGGPWIDDTALRRA